MRRTPRRFAPWRSTSRRIRTRPRPAPPQRPPRPSRIVCASGIAEKARMAMNRVRAIVKDEQGVAVVLALVALVALTALVLAYLAVSSFEPQISANLSSSMQARYLAEAGVEAA